MKIKSYIIALMALPFFFSCDEEGIVDDFNNDGGDDSEIIEDVPIKVYIDWNASFETVKDSTEGLALVESEIDFLHYYSEKMDQTVSYEFVENSLSAVAIVFPLSDSIQTLTSPLLDGFNYVGEKDSVSVYINELQNMFAVKYQTSELADSILGDYVVVGFTPITE